MIADEYLILQCRLQTDLPFRPKLCILTMLLSLIVTACPGGIQLPCSGRGRCIDGLLGNGTCVCDSSFNGTACEQCTNSSAESCPGI